ncbi:MAG: DUF4388 domain-containing protein [Calditrichia bacterium]
MVLVGNLKDLRLANIIQINCIEQNVAKVTVTSGERNGMLYFADGQIVHAEFNPFIGEKAVHEMLVVDDGQFKVEAGVAAPSKTIHKSWNSVVLEGLRLMDEKNQQGVYIPKELVNLISVQRGVKSIAVQDVDGKLVAGSLPSNGASQLFRLMVYKFRKILTLFYSDKFNYAYFKNESGYVFFVEVRPYLLIIQSDASIVVQYFLMQIKKLIQRIVSK